MKYLGFRAVSCIFSLLAFYAFVANIYATNLVLWPTDLIVAFFLTGVVGFVMYPNFMLDFLHKAVIRDYTGFPDYKPMPPPNIEKQKVEQGEPKHVLLITLEELATLKYLLLQCNLLSADMSEDFKQDLVKNIEANLKKLENLDLEDLL